MLCILNLLNSFLDCTSLDLALFYSITTYLFDEVQNEFDI